MANLLSPNLLNLSTDKLINRLTHQQINPSTHQPKIFYIAQVIEKAQSMSTHASVRPS